MTKALSSAVGVVVLAMAGLAFVTAPASATGLCNVKPEYGHECLEDHLFKTGTEFTATPKSSLVLKTGVFTVECSGYEISSATTSEGGEGSNVGIKFTGASFSGCNCPMEAQSIPWEGGSVAWTSGTDNGTLSVSSLRLKVTCSGISCTYGEVSGAKLEGGETALIWFENLLNKTAGSFLCSSTATLQGQSYYKPVYPSTDTYVSKNPRSVVLCSDKPCTKTYSLPAELKAKLVSATVFEFKYDKTVIKPSCSASEIKVPFSKAGSPLVGTSTTFEFSNCVSGSYTIAPETSAYRFELEPKGGGSGTLTMRATETSSSPIIKITNPGVFTCEYQRKEVPFSFTGGDPAKLDVSQVFANLSGGKCEGDMTWTASYEIYSPKPLYAF